MYIVLIILSLIVAGFIALFKNPPQIEEEEIKKETPIYNFKTLPHCLFYGPAGLGKTTLANVVQKECSKVYGVFTSFSVYTPSNLQTESDIYKLIQNITYGAFVFIDEIHGLDMKIEESLYSVMQDFQYFYNGQTIEVPKFTLIGATTLAGKINKPLRERFTLAIELDLMKEEDLINIKEIPTSFNTYQGQEPAKQLLKLHIFALKNDKKDKVEQSIEKEVAKRAFGNPRVYKQLLNHVVAFQTLSGKPITEQNFNELMRLLGMDEFGLNKADRRVLQTIRNSTKPIGETALAKDSFVSKDDLIEIIEPKLHHLGFIVKTARGRELSEKCKKIVFKE